MSRGRYYDDEEDYRSRRPSNHSLLLILGVGAGILGVCLVVCAGLFYLGMKAFSDAVSSSMTMAAGMQAEEDAAEAVANKFLNDVADGRIESAYASTTKAFQDGQPLPLFRNFVDRNPALKNYDPESLLQTSYTPVLATFEGNATSADGVEISFTIQVVKDGDAWKVDRFTIP
jgi:hypothetical protein